MGKSPWRCKLGVAIVALGATLLATSANAKEPTYLSPTEVVASADAKSLYIACATANRVIQWNIASAKVARTIDVPASPLGLALSPDGSRLFVTCAAPESTVCVIDTAKAKITKKLAAGHTAMAPVLSADGKTLYVCNRFNNEVAFIDVASGKTASRVAVPREPVAAALSKDGKLLLVANHIHAGRSDLDVVAASLSVIDIAAAKVSHEIALPNGSGLLRGIVVSPDGKHAALTHLLSRFHLPTTQIERGWINNAALTIIDMATLKPVNTVLLDNIDSGAANPWAIAWTADGKTILTTHAGTHEVTVIDAPALLAKLAKMPAVIPPGQKVDYTVASRVAGDVPNDLSFLVGLRTRVKLPPSDRAPRALALVGKRAFVANYFTDSLSVIDLGVENGRCCAESVPLGPRIAMTPARKGEFYFNDASICFQGWQSCGSCHSSDARVDGLNWDNLNDGIGNPKNAKSMLLAHSTPPSMWLGVRTNAEHGVRMGIKNSLFTVQPPEVADSIDVYLKSLVPIPSPVLEHGRLSASAERGKKIFSNETVGCADCHKGKFYTDLKLRDVGTRSQYDKPQDKFDTPTLIEVWRSAPYLHDGSAATIKDVLTTRNADDRHGVTSKLSPQEINDLAAFVLSL